MPSGALMVELRRADGLARICAHELFSEIVPRVQDFGFAPIDVGEAILVLVHSLLVMLFLRVGGHQVADDVNDVLEVLHADLPILLFIAEELVCHVWQDAPHMVRLGVLEPCVRAVHGVGPKDRERLAGPRKPVGEHDHRVAGEEVLFDARTDCLVDVLLTHHPHVVRESHLLSQEFPLEVEGTPPSVVECEARTVALDLAVEQVDLARWRILSGLDQLHT
mmetsp:Transcript_25406/g.70742  ORF Transcript_25406/g.70742 Transcript_25406/m.70742 type:complete len:221 (-) Transcript_25406:144-806(-)